MIFLSGTLVNTVSTSSGGLNLTTASNLTFSRSSIAYKLDGVTQVGSNQPRYEAGKYGSALLVEGGTANLLTANQSSAETDISGFSSYWDTSISRDTSKALIGSASIKVDTTSRANDGHENHGVIVNSISTTYSANTYFYLAVLISGHQQEL